MIFGKSASLLHSKNIHYVNLHQTQITISVASLNKISKYKSGKAKLVAINGTKHCMFF
jgi:hypothetical protein